MTEHTPTPWRYFPLEKNGERVADWVYGPQDQLVCDASFEDDARRIARAVNSHDELVGALQSLLANLSEGDFISEDRIAAAKLALANAGALT